ncbi:hypothetical protein AX17_005209 [Amanita inopinata Kibby_2008]|nr:hypothetical protein AX17_005209 [Amanita inopinata Kibby_2008]
MSLNHGSIATHVPQSLPSFAQAFSTQSLSNLSATNNALPPIHTRPSSIERCHTDSLIPPSRSHPPSADNPTQTTAGKKRSLDDVASHPLDDRSSDTSRKSPRLIHIKEEQDQEPLDRPSPSAQADNLPPKPAHDSGDASPPSPAPSPLKKRRVTISGAPHPLHTANLGATSDQANSTPISPVVMGFAIKRDNPAQLEQVRSTIVVKQKQKALIEQRRGSLSGTGNPPANSLANSTSTPVSDERLSSSSKTPSTRSLRRSPNTSASTASAVQRRHNPSVGGAGTRPPSPITLSAQQPTAVTAQAPTHSLPPPPISFARRRAAQLGTAGKKKPADIVISPREAQTPDQLQPAIQSAPPVPHAGQSSFHTGRFTMTLPRLPPVLNAAENVRRVASNVPPTPTRLSMQRQNPPTVHAPPPAIGLSGRSPPAASIPIASTLVPPTPSSLHHPGYTGDKAAFLAPFEVFYDALNDSKQLKKWLGEQLQKSNHLVQSLTQQQEKLTEVVEELVERKVAGIRSEMVSLQRRVGELEDALRVATSVDRQTTEISGGLRDRYSRNGTFDQDALYQQAPSIESVRMNSDTPRAAPSPAWAQDRDIRENQEDAEMGSPVAFSSRVHATSRPQPADSSFSRTSHSISSPSQGYRDGQNHLAPPSIHCKTPRSHHADRDRPAAGRSPSHPHPSNNGVERGNTSPHARGDGRREPTGRSVPDNAGDSS